MVKTGFPPTMHLIKMSHGACRFLARALVRERQRMNEIMGNAEDPSVFSETEWSQLVFLERALPRDVWLHIQEEFEEGDRPRKLDPIDELSAICRQLRMLGEAVVEIEARLRKIDEDAARHAGVILANSAKDDPSS